MKMEEVKLHPKLNLSTKGWRLEAVEFPEIYFIPEEEKIETAAILTVPVRRMKLDPDSVELF